MIRIRKKVDFPVERVRHFLEPGPVVLVSSRWKEETNLMTMGWHTVTEFIPSGGVCDRGGNHSFELVSENGECVINLPTAELIDPVVKIGNSSGREIDKFREYGLTAVAEKVGAPLVAMRPDLEDPSRSWNSRRFPGLGRQWLEHAE